MNAVSKLDCHGPQKRAMTAKGAAGERGKRRKTAGFRGRLRFGRNSRIGKNVQGDRYGVKEIGKIMSMSGNLA